ncbi:secreted frizzled-related protein 5-like, partial [Penaeus japonicus]|uniref:secreted frizzled-related protein 5-like n=1 Tax=Penaeus japonicus TaxID=27405 RepID=UPI001C7178AD
MLGGSALLPLPFLLLVLGAAAGTEAYFADWGMIGGRPQEPTCVDIPESMPLCSGIGYTKMRLPNLLEHDTLKEAQQQAGYWVPLLNLRCHADTQLFLCSLFTPVCLESPIYPCRSLCEAVRNGCESRMQTYSFPWPDMLRCDKFPLDNDMCITVQHTKAQRPGMWTRLCVCACVCVGGGGVLGEIRVCSPDDQTPVRKLSVDIRTTQMNNNMGSY